MKKALFANLFSTYLKALILNELESINYLKKKLYKKLTE
jgi:hypothetical protein